jgi:cytochrome c
MIVAAAVAGGTFACGGGSKKAEGRATPAEAQAMLQKAMDHYDKVGRDEAFADFNDKDGPWVDRDLYVFCLAKDHTIVANGGFPSLVGTPGDAIRGADGKSLAVSMFRAVEGSGEGIVSYTWESPVTHKVEAKISFVRRIADDLCGVGAYDPSSAPPGQS